MIKFYCQKARPIYVRTDDIWMTPSSKTAAGYVYVFTPDGYKDLVGIKVALSGAEALDTRF